MGEENNKNNSNNNNNIHTYLTRANRGQWRRRQKSTMRRGKKKMRPYE